MNPVVSVIIPTFNREDLLPRAISSVLGQSFKDFELIIVDDASTDNTKEIVSTYKDERIIYTRHESNRGQNAALNTGLSIAKGQYVSFLDSDDEWLLSFLSKLLFHMEDGGFDCVYCEAKWGDGRGIVKSFVIEGDIYQKALKQGYVSHMITILVKREAVTAVGGFDTQFTVCQDDDLCLRLSKICKFGLIKEQLAIVHNDATFRSFYDLNGYADGWKKLFFKFRNEILEFCGPQILANHFYEVALMYAKAGNTKASKEMFCCLSDTIHWLSFGKAIFYLPSPLHESALRVWRKLVRITGGLP